jgi:type VI secretion system protein
MIMAQTRRLIERLIHLGEANNKGQKSHREIATDSVVQHIRHILCTRVGSVLIDPLYGTGDFSDLPGGFASPETEQMQQDIANAIKQYEPRVKQVRVTFDGTSQEELALRFRLSATIEVAEQQHQIRLMTRISPDHSVQLDSMS